MGTFVTGKTLARSVLAIAAGSDLRCAVAFWGGGANSFLERAGATTETIRIVCDLSMGGCYPEALVDLGAPGNHMLRHRPGLHAKVYISDRGVVICSANASDNGLGFGSGEPGLLEAGTFHEPTSAVWGAAAEWFEDIYDKALPVDQNALDAARARYRPMPATDRPSETRPGSLLDMVMAQPELFEGVGFVVASERSTDEECAGARRSAVKAGIATKAEVESLPDGGMFIDWDVDEVLRWPVSFLELWMPKKSLRIYPRVVRAIDRKAGNVLTVVDKRSVQRLMPKGLLSLREAERIDADRVAALRDLGGGVFPTGAHLARALASL